MVYFKKISKRLSLTLIFLVISAAQAAEHDDGREKVRSQLENHGIQVQSLNVAEIDGWYEVASSQGLLYVHQSGQYLMAGQLFDISEDKTVNLTRQAQARMNTALVKELQPQMIHYPAAEEDHVITVFTDHTCGYCRTMHLAMDDFHDAGISVQYLAYPRAGAGSRGARELAAIWCAQNPQAALDSAKAGNLPEAQADCAMDIEKQWQAGRQMGVQGTPAIILPDGRLLTGFRAAGMVLSEIQGPTSFN